MEILLIKRRGLVTGKRGLLKENTARLENREWHWDNHFGSRKRLPHCHHTCVFYIIRAIINGILTAQSKWMWSIMVGATKSFQKSNHVWNRSTCCHPVQAPCIGGEFPVYTRSSRGERSIVHKKVYLVQTDGPKSRMDVIRHRLTTTETRDFQKRWTKPTTVRHVIFCMVIRARVLDEV
jgi:hypothetical protein